VDPITEQHLVLAERNRTLARTLLNGTIRPIPAEWATVVAFYADVHFDNAFLWERLRVAPRNHHERGVYVRTDRRLATIRFAYRRLQDAGYLARYDVTFRLAEQHARDLVDKDLPIIERSVRSALGMPLDDR